jgi:hypothetical protein
MKASKRPKKVDMDAFCPKCATLQNVPDEYRWKEIKCINCKYPFIPEKTRQFDIPPVIEDLKQKPENEIEYKPWAYLYVFGTIGIILSILAIFASEFKSPFPEIDLFLSLILLGLGSIVKAIYKK